MTLFVAGRFCKHYICLHLVFLSHNPEKKPIGCKHFALAFIGGVSLHTPNAHKALLILPKNR